MMHLGGIEKKINTFYGYRIVVAKWEIIRKLSRKIKRGYECLIVGTFRHKI